MSFSTVLDELMPDRVKIRTWSGVSTDGYAEPTFTTSTAVYKALITGKQTEVRSFEGEDLLATTVVWMKTTSTFGPQDALIRSTSTATLGDVLAVEAYRDTDSRHHLKVFLG